MVPKYSTIEYGIIKANNNYNNLNNNDVYGITNAKAN